MSDVIGSAVIGEDFVISEEGGTYTATSIIGARLADKLGPILSPDLARVLDAIGAMCEPLADVIEDQGFDGEAGFIPSYGRLFDPELCPAAYLPFLGNFVGVSVPIGASETEARALIKAESGLERGTEAAVKAAIERAISRFWIADTEYLEGQLVRHEATPGELLCYEVTTTFTSGLTFSTTHLSLVNIATYYTLIPRVEPGGDSNPYWFIVVVDPTNLLPENDATQLEVNVNGTKPAGLVWTAVLTDNPIWDQATIKWSEVGGSVLWATVTRAEIE